MLKNKETDRATGPIREWRDKLLATVCLLLSNGCALKHGIVGRKAIGGKNKQNINNELRQTIKATLSLQYDFALKSAR